MSVYPRFGSIPCETPDVTMRLLVQCYSQSSLKPRSANRLPIKMPKNEITWEMYSPMLYELAHIGFVGPRLTCYVANSEGSECAHKPY